MVKYRLANESDYESVNAFHNRIYNENRSLEQFYWEFHNCPHGKSIYVIAEDNDKIIGTNCVIPINLISTNKQIIRSGKSEDTLVDPAYRGQKIFYHIYEFLFEKCRAAGISVIWGFTSAIKPFKKLGFSAPYYHEQSLAVNKIGDSYRYLSSLNANNKTIDRLKILGFCILSKIGATRISKNQRLIYRLVEDEKVIEGVDALIFSNLSKIDSSFAINQSSDFQDWRIYNNPNYYKTHTFSFYNDEDLLIGLIIFNSHPNNVAFICQSTFHSSLDSNEKIRLLQFSSQKMFDSGISLIRNWHFDTNALNREEILMYKSAGYSYLKRGIGFVWKELDSIDMAPENFYISRISTQGVI